MKNKKTLGYKLPKISDNIVMKHDDLEYIKYYLEGQKLLGGSLARKCFLIIEAALENGN